MGKTAEEFFDEIEDGESLESVLHYALRLNESKKLSKEQFMAVQKRIFSSLKTVGEQADFLAMSVLYSSAPSNYTSDYDSKEFEAWLHEVNFSREVQFGAIKVFFKEFYIYQENIDFSEAEVSPFYYFGHKEDFQLFKDFCQSFIDDGWDETYFWNEEIQQKLASETVINSMKEFKLQYIELLKECGLITNTMEIIVKLK